MEQRWCQRYAVPSSRSCVLIWINAEAGEAYVRLIYLMANNGSGLSGGEPFEVYHAARSTLGFVQLHMPAHPSCVLQLRSMEMVTSPWRRILPALKVGSEPLALNLLGADFLLALDWEALLDKAYRMSWRHLHPEIYTIPGLGRRKACVLSQTGFTKYNDVLGDSTATYDDATCTSSTPSRQVTTPKRMKKERRKPTMKQLRKGEALKAERSELQTMYQLTESKHRRLLIQRSQAQTNTGALHAEMLDCRSEYYEIRRSGASPDDEFLLEVKGDLESAKEKYELSKAHELRFVEQAQEAESRLAELEARMALCKDRDANALDLSALSADSVTSDSRAPSTQPAVESDDEDMPLDYLHEL